MIDPTEIELIYSGGSSESPARDYIVVGGTSSTEERDYIVHYDRRLGGISSVIGVASFGNFWLDKYKAEIQSSIVGVASGTVDTWSSVSSVINIQSSQANIVFVRSLEINTSLIRVSGGSQDQWGIQASVCRVVTPQATLTVLREFKVNTSSIAIPASQANLFFINLGSSVVGIASTQTGGGPRLLLSATTSAIGVASFAAILRDGSLSGISSVVQVIGPGADFRWIPTGYLPGFPPTSFEFSPPKYAIEKLYTMAGGASRRLMCSKPSNASLALEYENISDYDAEQVRAAYEQSFGTRYGFSLPGIIVDGHDSTLTNYIRMLGTSNRWYFEDKPVIRSVINGVSTLSVQLRSRVDAQ